MSDLGDLIRQKLNAQNPQAQSVASPSAIPLLHRAEALINGDRQMDYGDKLENFSQIANLWTATLGRKLTQEITPEDVALCMIQVKIARLAKSPDHKDSILDVAGYAGCYDKLQEERRNNSLSLPGTLIDVRGSL